MDNCATSKHGVLVNFIKTLVSKSDAVRAFDEAGWTNHKGEPVTLNSLRNKIAPWLMELANESDLSSYRSLAYDDLE